MEREKEGGEGRSRRNGVRGGKERREQSRSPVVMVSRTRERGGEGRPEGGEGTLTSDLSCRPASCLLREMLGEGGIRLEEVPVLLLPSVVPVHVALGRRGDREEDMVAKRVKIDLIITRECVQED